MDLDDWRLVIVTICIVLVIVAFSPLIFAFIPDEGERFFALAILGEHGMAEEYFPDDDANIEIGENIQWMLYVYSHSGEVSYVSIRFKLLNATMSAPNSTFCRESVALIVQEINTVLMDNETFHVPVQWSLQGVSISENRTIIESLMFNDKLIQVNVGSLDENSFRFVIELWVYDNELKEFKFGWASGDEQLCAWNQVWFNVLG